MSGVINRHKTSIDIVWFEWLYLWYNKKEETKRMIDQRDSNPTQYIIIQLEIVSEDEQQQDIAYVNEVGRNIIDNLRENGYTVKPTYTGKMGGPVSVYDVLIHIYKVIHSNEELLAAMFASAAAILKFMTKRSRRTEKKTPYVPTPIEIAYPTSDSNAPLIIKAPDIDAAIRMLEQLKETHPDEIRKVIPQNRVKIKVSVPKSKKSRKHQ